MYVICVIRTLPLQKRVVLQNIFSPNMKASHMPVITVTKHFQGRVILADINKLNMLRAGLELVNTIYFQEMLLTSIFNYFS